MGVCVFMCCACFGCVPSVTFVNEGVLRDSWTEHVQRDWISLLRVLVETSTYIDIVLHPLRIALQYQSSK